MSIIARQTSPNKLLCLVLILVGYLWPQPLQAADKITLSADLSSSFINSETHSITGETSAIDSELYSQKYRLFFENEIYPLWKLRGGGLFEQNNVFIKEDGLQSDSLAIRKNPFINMILGSTLLNTSVGFNRREDVAKGSNQPTAKRFRDNYTGSLNYKPYDLPSLNLRLTRTNTYDGNRTEMDTTQDRLQVGSRYRPVKAVELLYSGQRNSNHDHLKNIETVNTINSGRVSYSDQFFNQRLSLSSTYSISHRLDELRAGQEGEIETDLTTEVGFYLYGLVNKINGPEEDELGTGPGQLNRTQTPPSEGSGINLGNQPAGSDSWNIGLEFTLATTLNLMRIFVTVPEGSPTQDLTKVAGSFSWDVYTSDEIENDGVNDIIKWTRVATGLIATYDAFMNSFDIRFSTVNTRFIKVVVAPLTNEPLYPNILVTGVTPFHVQPVADVERKSWRLTHLYNMSALARLLKDPGLNYNFTLFYTETTPTDSSRFSMSNGLSLRREFTNWLRGNARISRDDSRQRPSGDEQILYRSSLGLNATPLPTLNHTLTYSVQRAITNGETSVRKTLSLYNQAALYQGINLRLGISFSSGYQPEGQKNQSRLINYGLAIRPHRVLRMDLIGTTTRAKLTQPGMPESISTRQTNRFSLSYNPVTTLSFYLALEEVKRNEDRRTLQAYSISWSPLWGALHFNLSYSESQRPEDDSFNKTWSESLRWEIRPATNLDLTHSKSDNHNSTQDNKSEILTIALKARF